MLYKIQLEENDKNKLLKKILTFLAIAILFATSAYLIYPNLIKTESKNVELKPIVSSDTSNK